MGNKVNIAAVQFKWRLQDYKDRETFLDRVDKILEKIQANTGGKLPLLVVFPEDIGTPMLLFGLYNSIKDKPTFAQAVVKLIARNFIKVMKYKLMYNVSLVRALLLSKGTDMECDYISVFSNIASKYNVYIVAGSINLPDIESRNGKSSVSAKDVYNVSFLFGPDGAVIGRQKKVYLVDFEGKSGFDLSNASIDDIKVFNTPFGSLGIAICLDAFKEDVCDRLSDAGADILVQPSANESEWSKSQQQDWLNGAYLACHTRKKFKYAVNTMMNGNIFDLKFEGQSSIISRENTESKTNYTFMPPCSGFVDIADEPNSEEILIHTLEI